MSSTVSFDFFLVEVFRARFLRKKSSARPIPRRKKEIAPTVMPASLLLVGVVVGGGGGGDTAVILMSCGSALGVQEFGKIEKLERSKSVIKYLSLSLSDLLD